MRGWVVLAVFLAVTASAAPTITSVSPASGKVAGGEVLTIKGSGFSNCLICSPPQPPEVSFGRTPARSVRLVDATTLEVTTPALLPATYDITVNQFDQGSARLSKAYSVTGDPSEGFETILLPIFSRPVFGAFGSEFHTLARVTNKMDVEPVPLYGEDVSCLALPAPGQALSPTDPIPVPATGQTIDLDAAVACSNWPARLLYVPKDKAFELSFNLRVLDVTRTASSLGTEIPIIRSSEMTNGRIVLLDVPIDRRFRNTLRIYALRPTVAFVTTVGQPITIALQPGNNIFEPAYAQFSEFPIPIDAPSAGTIRVVIEQPRGIIPGPPMWAFISVTNNETQQITTITPD